jgi:hypothetical protein
VVRAAARPGPRRFGLLRGQDRGAANGDGEIAMMKSDAPRVLDAIAAACGFALQCAELPD